MCGHPQQRPACRASYGARQGGAWPAVSSTAPTGGERCGSGSRPAVRDVHALQVALGEELHVHFEVGRRGRLMGDQPGGQAELHPHLHVEVEREPGGESAVGDVLLVAGGGSEAEGRRRQVGVLQRGGQAGGGLHRGEHDRVDARVGAEVADDLAGRRGAEVRDRDLLESALQLEHRSSALGEGRLHPGGEVSSGVPKNTTFADEPLLTAPSRPAARPRGRPSADPPTVSLNAVGRAADGSAAGHHEPARDQLVQVAAVQLRVGRADEDGGGLWARAAAAPACEVVAVSGVAATNLTPRALAGGGHQLARRWRTPAPRTAGRRTCCPASAASPASG